MSAFLSWPIAYIPDDILIPNAYQIAERFHVSYFDSLYLALADATSTPFLHADGKLRNALHGMFPQEMWIEDYSLQ